MLEAQAEQNQRGRHPLKTSKAKHMKPTTAAYTEYDQQAEHFLSSNGIKFRATLSDSKTPAWDGYTPTKPCPHCIKSSGIVKREYPLGHPQTVYEQQMGRNKPIYTHCEVCKRTGKVPDLEARKHGHHYRVTLSGFDPRDAERLTLNPAKRKLVFDFWGSIADAEKGIQTVRPYDVLACISSDAYTPETFEDFCADYGHESDSIKALQTFRRCSAFAKRLRAFFTEAELEQLSEIR